MRKQKKQQTKIMTQVVIALPVNALKGMSPLTVGHFSSSPSPLGDTQELTLAVIGRSDLFPCTKKRSWGNKLIIGITPE